MGLIQNLVGGFWRTLAAAEAAEGDGDGGDGVLECMGTLRAMATVLDAVSDVPSLFPQLEPLLLPVLQRTLRADGQDVYEEALQARWTAEVQGGGEAGRGSARRALSSLALAND